MDIRWLGTATVEISCGGKRILIDPYFQNFSKICEAQRRTIREAVSRADVILITHPHLDHFSDIAEIARLAKAPIYVSAGGIGTAEKRKADCSLLRPLGDGMEISPGEGIRIRVWRSRHVQFDRKTARESIMRALLPVNFVRGVKLGMLNRAFRIAEDDVFAFEISYKGRTVFLLGSANLCEDVRYPERMDCLIYPCQGRSDMEEYSVPLIERLRPGKILLSHFDDAFPPISKRVDTSAFCRKYPNAEEPEFGRAIGIGAEPHG